MKLLCQRGAGPAPDSGGGAPSPVKPPPPSVLSTSGRIRSGIAAAPSSRSSPPRLCTRAARATGPWGPGDHVSSRIRAQSPSPHPAPPPPSRGRVPAACPGGTSTTPRRRRPPARSAHPGRGPPWVRRRASRRRPPFAPPRPAACGGPGSTARPSGAAARSAPRVRPGTCRRAPCAGRKRHPVKQYFFIRFVSV